MLAIRNARTCWQVAQRALAASANVLSESSLATQQAPALFRSALQIAAAHVSQGSTCQSPSAYRWFSQAAAVPQQQSADIHLTEAAIERIQELSQDDSSLVLRLRVDAGGCSGFSYKFDLEGDPLPDDVVVQQQGVQLVTDSVSYELLKGATVDYTTDLIRASFEVTENPNASGSCGCGASFEPKM